MNREMRRLVESEERRQKQQQGLAAGAIRRAKRAPAPAERLPLPRRIASFLREVRAELRRVSWPTRQQMIAFTSVTLITSVVLTLVVFGFDIVMKQLVLLFVSRGTPT